MLNHFASCFLITPKKFLINKVIHIRCNSLRINEVNMIRNVLELNLGNSSDFYHKLLGFFFPTTIRKEVLLTILLNVPVGVGI